MASGVSRPLVSSLKGRRMYSAAAATAKITADEREPRAYVKKISNGMLVGTIENQSPVARLAVVANAGSRYESGDNLGVAHVLRHLAKLRTQNLSSLGITRASLQLGSDVTVQGTREYLYYKSNVTRNCVPKMVEILREMTTKPILKHWELERLQEDPNSLKLDLALLKSQPLVCLTEMLHAAAFRTTLGRSLYAPDFMIGDYTPKQILHYMKTYFSAGRLALCGVGIDQNELEELASQFEPFGAAGVPQEAALFQGGEIRKNTGGDLTYVAVAFGGPSQTSKDLLPSEVLRHVMGTGPRIKYSSGTAASQLGKAVVHATDTPFTVSSLNANYSDAGLFGFIAVAPSLYIDKVVRAAANQFKTVLSGGVSEADIQRAKQQLKAEIAMMFEHPDNLMQWLGEQTLNCDQILTPQEVYKMVDPITTSDINSVAKKIAASKVALATTGNIESVPYLDKLFS